MDPTTTIFLVLLAIAMEAFFSGSEIGMVSVNRIKMQKLAEEGLSLIHISEPTRRYAI